MNTESLHALTIDRHFGELSREAAELLDHYLAQNPDARSESERILQSVAVTGEAMALHPELARVGPVAVASPASTVRVAINPWLMRAAAFVLLTGTAAAMGFVAGRTGTAPQVNAPVIVAASQNPSSSANHGPWARYRVSYDPTGSGMQVVRVDVPHPERKVLR
jgi:hypothetical protein